MLAIEREPLYKRKLFLSGVAVMSGFLLTVGIIRMVNPTDQTTNQSATTSSDERAASLIPVNASDSETDSESDKKTSSKQKTETADKSGSAASSTPLTSSEGWSQTSPSSSSSSPQPTSSSSSTSSTKPSGSTSTSSDDGRTQPSQPPDSDSETDLCVEVAGIQLLPC